MDAKINKKYTKGALDRDTVKRMISELESDPNVPDWAKQTTKPSYDAEELGVVGDKYITETSGSHPRTNLVTLTDCSMPDIGIDSSSGAIAFFNYFLEKALQEDLDFVKLKTFYLNNNMYFIPVQTVSSKFLDNGTDTLTVKILGVVFDNDLSTSHIVDVYCNATVDSNIPTLTQMYVERICTKPKVIQHLSSENNVTIEPNVLHVWGEISALTIALETVEDATISEYMFEFISGSTPTSLSISVPTGYPAIKWVEDWTPEANKIYQVSIVNNIGLVVSVDLPTTP